MYNKDMANNIYYHNDVTASDIAEAKIQFEELYSNYPELDIEEKDILNNTALFLLCNE